ncbi:MAG: DUF975 family protein [Parcubacteria group bacterium]
MKTENKELMRQAREALVGKWGSAVGVTAIYILIVIALQSIPKTGGLFSIIFTGPLTLGAIIFALAISRKQDAKVDQLFSGFKRFGTALIAHVLIGVFVLLWSLLLIVPGIIAGLSYGMTFFILADDDNISPREAIKMSKKMMYGHKWKYFKLSLRFAGWFILSILTLGIGLLWVIPYMWVSLAKFYEDIKNGESVV